MFTNKKGFTLVEMLIVLLVITILMIVIIPNLNSRSDNIHSQSCESLQSIVQSQVHLYHVEEGEFPSSLGEMAPEYITEDQLTCSGGQELQYNSTDGIVTIPGELVD